MGDDRWAGQRYVDFQPQFERSRKKLGITDLIWHDLRRTAGCRWLQDRGKNLLEVRTMLGHSSVKVTETVYAFLEGRKVAEDTAGRQEQL
jgi:integrase